MSNLPSAPEFGSAPQYPIESVDNALRVVLLGEHHSLRLTDVSKYLGMASSTAHRLLAILQYRGYVQQDATTRSYVPGPTLDSLAFGLLRRLDARDRARPVLERLNNDLGETVHLGRLEGNEVHFIDSIESDRALRVANRLGAPAWRNLRVPVDTLPDDTTAIRLVVRDLDPDPSRWIAFTPPRMPELVTMQELVGDTRPVLPDWAVAFHVPCLRPRCRSVA